MKKLLLMTMLLLAGVVMTNAQGNVEDPDVKYAADLLRPGTVAPDFTIRNPVSVSNISLDSLRGHYVLDLVFLVVVGHIHLASENGLERLKPLLDPFFVHDGTIIKKLLDAIHHPVIRDGHAFHAVLDSLVHKIPHLRLTVEHRVMRMYVQMHKIFHVRIKFIGVKLRLNSDMTKRIIQKRLSFK